MSLAILCAALAVDQMTKMAVVFTMMPGQSLPESGLFRFTYLINTGSAFGFFPNQTLFLIIASFVGIGVLLVFYRTHPVNSTLLQISLGLQLGGATGNLVDRVRLGYVVDFIDVGVWPVFNLADSAIVMGLLGLLWTLAFTSGKPAPKLDTVEDGVLSSETFGQEATLDGELEKALIAESSVPAEKGKP
ncbi:MAG: signal peptidase II [Chloroflexi bacterium]|nr:signal peptidase II [Chloroflexota bacterium]